MLGEKIELHCFVNLFCVIVLHSNKQTNTTNVTCVFPAGQEGVFCHPRGEPAQLAGRALSDRAARHERRGRRVPLPLWERRVLHRGRSHCQWILHCWRLCKFIVTFFVYSSWNGVNLVVVLVVFDVAVVVAAFAFAVVLLVVFGLVLSCYNSFLLLLLLIFDCHFFCKGI